MNKEIISIILGVLIFILNVMFITALIITSLRMFGLDISLYNYHYYIGGVSLFVAILTSSFLISLFIKNIFNK